MPDITTLVTLAVILMGIGAFAGVLAGLLGVGGGIVLVPAFLYTFSALGYDGPQLMQICLATSLATIIVTSIRSVLSHNRKGAVDWGILKTWAPGIMVGALVGVLVASNLRSTVLQGIFGVLGMCIALYLAFGRQSWKIAEQMPGRAVSAPVSAVIGFLSVLMGIGGGSFAVPTMTLYGQPIHRAVATAAGFGLCIALPSAIAFFFVSIPTEAKPPLTLGAVNIPAFLIVIAMTMITAPLGAKLAHKMNPKPLKRVFALFLMVVAGRMLLRTLGV
ncbi:sulfite exporter TauE/SafE family protein [Actibacterium sp. XHP0104]|uniref:sulfite exporter TauE/SafE family protein n=1 Tax=Actibacterium sp. XHP0104 TaxID=2984335 RepID=UPI0021E7DDCB|nr:sulfite exporter TauE/SafE family protein [Actibacterium sp. XHP0104]MCV2881521.1 sulfite exporter TauE/SafE family protein [Actibacterium sp. XHP0104]